MFTKNFQTSPEYNYAFQSSLRTFWERFDDSGERRVLLIFGHGFDPRCCPALENISRLVRRSKSSLTTFCARFTNLHDVNLKENVQWSLECLSRIRQCTKPLIGAPYRHFEVEVNLFSPEKEMIGGDLLIREFADCLDIQFDQFTDVIVDIGAFPRSLMYTLVAHLWERRRPRQNLFLTLTDIDVKIEESDYVQPSLVLGQRSVSLEDRTIWIPVLGGDAERFEKIHAFLRPAEIYPIIPFPSENPRSGDDILLRSRQMLFEKWGVRTSDVLYASGSVPHDLFRKISDFVAKYRQFTDDGQIVISALSGRTLSLGALLAALWGQIALCHSQPTTYKMNEADRNELSLYSSASDPKLFWIAGEIYEN